MADSEAANFNEAGQGRRRANHQRGLMGPDMDAVVSDQPGGGDMACAAGQQEVEGQARFAGPRRSANENGAISHPHRGCADAGVYLRCHTKAGGGTTNWGPATVASPFSLSGPTRFSAQILPPWASTICLE